MNDRHEEVDQMWARRFDDPGAKRLSFGEGAAIDVLTEEASAQLAAIRVRSRRERGSVSATTAARTLSCCHWPGS